MPLHLLAHPHLHILRRPRSHSVSTMASSLLLPSVSPRNLSFSASHSFRGFNLSGFSPRNVGRSRVSMSVSVGSRTCVDDALFADYKPTCAFLFPGQNQRKGDNEAGMIGTVVDVLSSLLVLSCYEVLSNGAQAVGMGSEAQSVPAAADLYKKANDILGFDLLDVCINGPKEKLDSTVLSQPAIYVTSLAAVEVLRARDGGQQIIDSVDVTCGLSLGEYTALAFAGAFRNGGIEHLLQIFIWYIKYPFELDQELSFEDGLKLVKLRGEAMQDAADAAKSAMVSVIGLDSEKVQLLCDAANEEVDEDNKVQIANFLCPGNYAVSGGVKGVEAVEAKAKSFKARMTVRLAVAGAFHTHFMEPAVSRLEATLAATEIRTPRIPVISNVDAQPHADPDTIKKILARQVTSPVLWETTVKTLLTKGLKKSYELGPGKVIAGIFKRMDKTADLENVSA
ncbi:Malonyl-CoA-acyl carrier protein transacylase, mitochondrial [Vitis vinifera]|uniref:Malonyl-CoA-acyl carrier protein transacylase, mitochondrial n=1 Tax=Vitis vinifera TaxID=29760 RepID=A0A438FA56_VITVI|nr:Malonyl-CoA-acyl carrier protein transacylase, mitochondrial [Vitis vinifera]